MSTPPPRRALDASRITAAAVTIADADGLDAVSMRRLADSLGVTPMALYKHVGNREQLIDAMVDGLVAAIPTPERSRGWKRALRARILAARSALGTHPWARDAIETRTFASPTVLAYMNSLMAVMFDGGLSADLVHHTMHALSTRMWGFTRDVMPTPTVPDDPAERAAALSSFAATYPAIIRMATTAPHAGADCDDDAEFAFALELILDGIEQRHDRGWSSVGESDRL